MYPKPNKGVDTENGLLTVDASEPLCAWAKPCKDAGWQLPLDLLEGWSLLSYLTYTPVWPQTWRWGTWADQVLGAAFRYSNRTVELGGKTLKNVAGYNLLHYLLPPPDDFELMWVRLRLHPWEAMRGVVQFSGNESEVHENISKIMHSEWGGAAEGAMITHHASSVTEGYVFWMGSEADAQAWVKAHPKGQHQRFTDQEYLTFWQSLKPYSWQCWGLGTTWKPEQNHPPSTVRDQNRYGLFLKELKQVWR